MSKAAELANLIGNINAGGGGVNRNVIINGAMNVAQRGTSETGVGASSGYFTLDRWKYYSSGTAGRVTLTQDSSAPDGFANSFKVDVTTADTSIAAGEQVMIQQRIEGQNLQHFKKGTSDALPWALSFYVKGNASATYAVELMDADNSDRHVNKLFNVTTDWTRVEITFPADTTGTMDDDNAVSIDLQIILHSGTNFTSGTLQQTWGALNQTNRAVGISSIFDSTDRTFFITGVQLEVGQNATEFEHEPYATTKNKCLRYYWRQGGGGVCLGSGTYYRANLFAMHQDLAVPMRAAPTLGTEFNSNSFIIYTNNAVDYCDGFSLGRSNANESGECYAIQWDSNTSASGTIGHGGVAVTQQSGQYVEFTAEL